MKNLIRDPILQVELINAMSFKPKAEELHMHDFYWQEAACLLNEVIDRDMARVNVIDAILEDCL